MRNLLALLALASLAVAGCSQPPPAPTPPPLPDNHLASMMDDQRVDVPRELAGGLDVALRPTNYRGGEPNIGITSAGAMFVIGGQVTLKSTDLGRTWSESFNMTAFWGPAADSPLPNSWPTVANQSVPQVPIVGTPGPDQVRSFTRSSDPMLWVDPDTDRIFTDHMTGLYCSKLFLSDDEGAAWTPSPVDCGVPVNDHQKLMTAHYGPDGPPSGNPAYPNVVYYCYNKLVATNCAVSFDGGLTFQYDRPATIGVKGGGEASAPQAQAACGGLNGHPAGAPDGTVYVPLNDGCPGPVVLVTTDNGLTWTARDGPTAHGAEEIDPDITVTPDGTAYMLYRGKDHLQYLVRSHDRFATFEGPWRVSLPEVRSTVYTVITSGDDGRIAMAYLGTRDSKKAPSAAENTTRWHLYETVSLDAEAQVPTFTTKQVTPDDDPVQIGCVWLNGGGNPCRNMLDFIDMAHTPDGRPVVVFTDGCTKDCAGNATATEKQSRSGNVTVAVMEAGPSLFAAKGLLAPSKP
ncbi:MAG: sialidase family protein [Thermoplasmatota archaeon]